MINRQTKPNLDHNATADEVRTSMLRWFSTLDGMSKEDWISFKAHLYPNPLGLTTLPPSDEPDYEAIRDARMYD